MGYRDTMGYRISDVILGVQDSPSKGDSKKPINCNLGTENDDRPSV